MKISIHPSLVYRIPRFTMQASLQECWEELKEAIKLSSEDFYEKIKDIVFSELGNSPPQVQATVWKYFNRSRFRPTPYGIFATVGFSSMQWDKNASVIVEEEVKPHRYMDWSQAKGLNMPNFEVHEVKFFSNTTYYTVQDDIRFIRLQDGEFQIAAIDKDPIVSAILEYCQQPRSFSQLLTILEHKIDHAVLTDYLEDLVGVQLLITSLEPNIIGQDYFQRVNISPRVNRAKYIIAERRTLAGSIDAGVFRHMGKLISLLHNLVPAAKQPDLAQFRERYLSKFEQLEMPLMVALDPEIGIGYGAMEQHDKALAITYNINGKATTPEDPEVIKLRNALYPEIIKALGSKKPIRLEEIMVVQPANGTPLPNSLSALVSLSDDNIFLEAVGGSTAISLLGRFGLAIAEVHKLCEDIAGKEQEANPEVLFFDVGYIKEGKVDNINRRPAIYPLQLSILNYDTSHVPLSLTDLLVSVRGSAIILRSRKYNKRLVPRLATAYNFTRSDLSVFRFLMDLQQQGLHSQLLFKPFNLIPDLDHYPRVQFANIVVSREAWTLTTKIFEEVTGVQKNTAKLKAYLATNVTCRYLRVGDGDQKLCLDITDSSSIELLAAMINKSGSVIAEEFFPPTLPIVTDQSAGIYLPEVILTLQHQESIYKPLPDLSYISADLNKKIWVPPGADWLYFEIFTNDAHADAILAKIKIYLAQFRSQIKLWFFIRYDEDGQHLRLRIKLKQYAQGYSMINALSKVLENEINSGIVSDVRLRTYKKEIQRYSLAQMDNIETHFCQDSIYVMKLIDREVTEMQKYRLSIEVLRSLCDSKLMEQEHFQKLIGVTMDAFLKEHNAGPATFKELNKMYRDYLSQQPADLDAETLATYAAFKRSFLKTIENTVYKARAKRAADLMHMHINRLFPSSQRTHEMIIYYFITLIEKQNRKRNHIAAGG